MIQGMQREEQLHLGLKAKTVAEMNGCMGLLLFTFRLKGRLTEENPYKQILIKIQGSE